MFDIFFLFHLDSRVIAVGGAKHKERRSSLCSNAGDPSSDPHSIAGLLSIECTKGVERGENPASLCARLDDSVVATHLRGRVSFRDVHHRFPAPWNSGGQSCVASS